MRRLAELAVLGTALIAAAGCARSASTQSTQSSAPATQPVRAALPEPTAKQKTLAANKCLGVHHDAAPKYNAEQPDAFASSGPGSAELLVYVDPHGKPVAALTLSASSPAYAAAANNVVAGWSFAPATCNGKPQFSAYDVRMQ